MTQTTSPISPATALELSLVGVYWPSYFPTPPTLANMVPTGVNYTVGTNLEDAQPEGYSVVLGADSPARSLDTYGIITAIDGVAANFIRIEDGTIDGVVGNSTASVGKTYVYMTAGTLASLQVNNGISSIVGYGTVVDNITAKGDTSLWLAFEAYSDYVTMYNNTTLGASWCTVGSLILNQNATASISTSEIGALHIKNRATVTIETNVPDYDYNGTTVDAAYIWFGSTIPDYSYIANYDNAVWGALTFIMTGVTAVGEYSVATAASTFDLTVDIFSTNLRADNYLGGLSLTSNLLINDTVYALELVGGDLILAVADTMLVDWPAPPFADVAPTRAAVLANDVNYGMGNRDIFDGVHSVVAVDGNYGTISGDTRIDNYIRISGGVVAGVVGTNDGRAATFVHATGGELTFLESWNGTSLFAEDASAGVINARGSAGVIVADNAVIDSVSLFNSATMEINGGDIGLLVANQSGVITMNGGNVDVLNLKNRSTITVTDGSIGTTNIWFGGDRHENPYIIGYDNGNWGSVSIIISDLDIYTDYVVATDAAGFDLAISIFAGNTRPANFINNISIGEEFEYLGRYFLLNLDADNTLVLTVTDTIAVDWPAPPFATDAPARAYIVPNTIDYTPTFGNIINGVYSVVMVDGDYGTFAAARARENYLRISGGNIARIIGTMALDRATYVNMTGGEVADIEIRNGITRLADAAYVQKGAFRGTAHLEMNDAAVADSIALYERATMTMAGGTVTELVANQYAAITMEAGSVADRLHLKNRSTITVTGGAVNDVCLWASPNRADDMFITGYDNAVWGDMSIILSDVQEITRYAIATDAYGFNLSVDVYQTNMRDYNLVGTVSVGNWFVIGLSTYSLNLTADGNLYLEVLGGIVSDWPAPPFDPNFPNRVARVLGNNADYTIGTDLPDFTDGVYSVVMTKDIYGHITAGAAKDNYIRVSGGLVAGITGTATAADGRTFVYLTGGELVSLEVWNGISLLGNGGWTGSAAIRGNAYLETSGSTIVDDVALFERSTMMISGGTINNVVANQNAAITMTGGVIANQLHLKNRSTITFDGSDLEVNSVYLWASAGRSDSAFIINLDAALIGSLSVVVVDPTVNAAYTLAGGVDSFDATVSVYSVNTRNLIGTISVGEFFSDGDMSYGLKLFRDGSLRLIAGNGIYLDWWDGNEDAPMFASVFSGTGTVVMGQDGYVVGNDTAMIISGASAATIYGGDSNDYDNSWIQMRAGEEITIYGAGEGYIGTARMDIRDGSTDLIVGGGTGTVGNIDIYIEGGTHNSIYAGADLGGVVEGDVVLLAAGGTFSGVINAGLGAVLGNTNIVISDAVCDANVYGGTVNSYVAGSTEVLLFNTTMTGMVNGGGRAEDGGVSVTYGTYTTIGGSTTLNPNKELLDEGFSTAFVFGGGHAVRGSEVYNHDDSVIYVFGYDGIPQTGNLVGGGAADGEGSMAFAQDTYIIVEGAEVGKHIFGGGYAHNGGYAEVQNTNITIITEEFRPVSIVGNVYGGGYTPLEDDGSVSIVTGNSTITFTGNGAFLDFTGKVNGSSFRENNGGVAGVKALCFESFTGDFNATIQNMDIVMFAGNTSVVSTVGFIGSVFGFSLGRGETAISDVTATGFEFDDTVADNALNLFIIPENSDYTKALMALESDDNLVGMNINLFDANTEALIGSFLYGESFDLGTAGITLNYEDETLKVVYTLA